MNKLIIYVEERVGLEPTREVSSTQLISNQRPYQLGLHFQKLAEMAGVEPACSFRHHAPFQGGPIPVMGHFQKYASGESRTHFLGFSVRSIPTIGYTG